MKIILDHVHPYIWQWDKNHRIIITDGVANCEVHFANGIIGQNALVTMSYSEKGVVYANIPNVLLQVDSQLKVFVYQVNGDKAYTETEWTIDVVPRAKPDDYIYTEVEILNYYELEKRIEELENALKPAEITEVIVDNKEGDMDYSLQSFVYTLPTDNTVIEVDGWGCADRIYFNYRHEEGMDFGDCFELSQTSSITLPADLPQGAVGHWKAGTAIKVLYSSDIITSAVATYSKSGRSADSNEYYTKAEVDAKIKKAIDEALGL